MKRTKKRKWSVRALAAMLIAILAMPTYSLRVHAEENELSKVDVVVTNKEIGYKSTVQPLTTMFDCEIIMAFTMEGLEMTFTTLCVDVASVIGVKDIKVQQKMWYGWKTVFTSSGAEIKMKIFLQQSLLIRMLLTEKHIELFAPTMLIMMVMKK